MTKMRVEMTCPMITSRWSRDAGVDKFGDGQVVDHWPEVGVGLVDLSVLTNSVYLDAGQYFLYV